MLNTSFNFKIEVSPENHIFFYYVFQGDTKEYKVLMKTKEQNILLFKGKERDCHKFLCQLKRSYLFVNVKPF